jgi:DMSO reductase anchor subunit
LHLGRPLHAWRAVVGLTHSWLSREVVAFGLFAGAALLGWLDPRAQAAAALLGLFAVGCSVMVYAATGRPAWSAPATGLRFFGTAAILGAATMILVSGATRLHPFLIGASLVKLAGEAAVFRHLRGRQWTPLKRTALLMCGELSQVAGARFFAGLVGGVVLPAVAYWAHAPLGYFIFVLTLLGECQERHLFFAATSAPRMPGAPA